MLEYAGVHILDMLYTADEEYDYQIPPELAQSVKPGVFVSVSFGMQNRERMAVVTSLKEKSAYAKTAKFITSVCPDNEAVLNEEQLSLCRFLKSRTLCTIGDAVRAMMPTGMLYHLETFYEPTDNLPDNIRDMDIYEYIASKGKVSGDALNKKFPGDARRLADGLCQKGYLRRFWDMKAGAKELLETQWEPALSEEMLHALIVGDTVGDVVLKNDHQRDVLQALIDAGEPISSAELRRICRLSSNAIFETLEKKGVLKRQAVTIDRNPYKTTAFKGRTPIVLNEEQKAAFQTLLSLANEGVPRAGLLFGVTGSGKTSVMTALMDALLDQGKSVILLVPEIALTPQSVGIFCGRYGDTVTVMHSALSVGERFDAYKKILRGESRVIIGTRSAVFAPAKNLGAIIIDEEQETTYKSDCNPKYQTRDVAAFRCGKNNCLMVPASATPSVESFYKAASGQYTLIPLHHRYGDAKLPEVTVADVREEAKAGVQSPLGNVLLQKLSAVYQNGEQAILFLNRRGFHRYVSCPDCGQSLSCPNCSVTLTYHTFRSRPGGELVCHWCGHRENVPKFCPDCGGTRLEFRGYGTQRVESELKLLFPNARILRMDTDTTVTKDAYDKILSSFRNKEADFLIGTQMVTKGHDFPRVTLVGVLQGDDTRLQDDYRGNERCFSLLTQVVGRAGRGEIPGEAVIQTKHPDSDNIALACKQDYEAFYQDEIRLRKLLNFPPFCTLVLFVLDSEQEPEVLRCGPILLSLLKTLQAEEHRTLPMELYGPYEAPIYRMKNRCRVRILMKTRACADLYELLDKTLRRFPKAGGKLCHLSLDINPSRV